MVQIELLMEAQVRLPGFASAPDGRRREPTTRKLPELYYLHHFSGALADVRSRYDGLLDAKERVFLAAFDALPRPAQCLLTRMLMRRGELFRLSSLYYPEVPDLEGTLQLLSAAELIDSDPLLTGNDLAMLLTRSEWRQAFGSRRTSTADSELPQLKLPLAADAPLSRRIAEWHPRWMDRCVRVQVATVARRLQALYFGNGWQSWAEFVLSDLGLQRYERVAYDAMSCAFRSRQDIEHFHRLNECLLRLRQQDAAIAILPHAWRPEGLPEWLDIRFAALQTKLGEILSHQGAHALAIEAFREARDTAGRIGIMRLYERQGLLAQALDEAVMALPLTRNEAERNAVMRRLQRLRRRLGSKCVAEPRRRHNSLDLEATEDHSQSVEQSVCAILSTGARRAYYVENSLFPALFGLLFWDAIFSPVPGAFFHPFQIGPADLFSPRFRAPRAALIQDGLDLLGSGRHVDVILGRYRTKAGTCQPFVKWSRLRPQVLLLALRCIPAAHLRLIFERLLEDLENHRCGLPDIVEFDLDARSYRLLEVKAPGDRLQHNQRAWMDFFDRHGIPAAVCRVQWKCSSGPTRNEATPATGEVSVA